MAALVVNVVLILAVLVLAAALLIGAARRRRQGRHQNAEERRLILQAFLGAAASTSTTAPQPLQPAEPAAAPKTGAVQRLDAESVAALLDLLEEGRPVRRGLFTGQVNGPRAAWAAGARSGRQVGRRTMGERAEPGTDDAAGPGLYRAAAAELVDIHAHDQYDAQLEYRRYAVALGDPALAELYLRSAAYATYPEHQQVRRVLEQITGTAQTPGSVG
jgi:hypothetical protein